MEIQESASGVLQLSEKGQGYLRQPGSNYLPRPKDVFVPQNLVKRLSLREGLYLDGQASPAHDGRGRNRPAQLVSVEQINGLVPGEYARRPDFNSLISLDPTEMLELSRSNPNQSMRVID
ncbi:MAG TPA: transcription termination factor Rho, partial [Blastocatellia bacterium]